MATASPMGRLLPTITADGQTQMALDQLLLDQDSKAPVLRFYRWEGAWLSLGRHQTVWPEHWSALQRHGRLNLVRRPSGGQAVLHAGGLTYALIWPSAPRQRREAYRQACQWLVDGFKTLGLPLRFGDEPSARSDANCFARSTAADLVDDLGVKRIGSAQRWLHGRLLQHGEILLDPPAALWRDVFGSAAPPAAPSQLDRAAVEPALLRALPSSWPGLSWEHQPLRSSERQSLERSLADASDWLSIERTNCGNITRPKG